MIKLKVVLAVIFFVKVR